MIILQKRLELGLVVRNSVKTDAILRVRIERLQEKVATIENSLSAEFVHVLTGRDLEIVRDGKVEASGLLQEGDLVVEHLSDLDGVRAQDLDNGGLLLQLDLNQGVGDGGGGVRNGQPPVHSLVTDNRLDSFLKQNFFRSIQLNPFKVRVKERRV